MKRFLLPLVADLLGCASSSRSAEAHPRAVVNYLRTHQATVDPAGNAGAELLDLAGKEIFLCGEIHGVAATNAVDLNLLRYLHAHAGVRTYISEISSSHAECLNRYLATGDETLLDFLFSRMNHVNDRSRDRRQFWIDLRAWNQSLPAAERVRIAGVDLERFQPEITVAAMQRLLQGREVPPEISAAVQRVEQIAPQAGDETVKTAIDALETSVATHRARYATLLAEQLTDLDLAVANLKQRFRCFGDRAHFDAIREQAMEENFRVIAAHTGKGNFYGRMGSAHMLQRRFDDCDRFAARLGAAGSPWQGKVLTIWPLYLDCENLAFRDGRYTHVPCRDDPVLAAPFALAAKGAITLFKLDAPESPFWRRSEGNGGLWLWRDDRFKFVGRAGESFPGAGGFAGGAVADYFQYVVLFRGAKAAESL